MIDDNHHRILQAATLVYAQHGWRGATTRRIAEEAGVNEVTIFRHFGSKDALLDAAILRSANEDALHLAADPEQPESELHEWAKAQHEKISRKRAFVRQLMSDAADRPDAAACAGHGPNIALSELRAYVDRLRRRGFVAESSGISPAEVGAAATMLMGAVFSDAMNRDLMPDMFPQPKEETLLAYVRIFLRGLGALSQPVRATMRTEHVVSPTTSAIPE
jgi:AcrR family transcriptional regulator